MLGLHLPVLSLAAAELFSIWETSLTLLLLPGYPNVYYMDRTHKK